jgi:tRNA(Ile)-lysidine synthase
MVDAALARALDAHTSAGCRIAAALSGGMDSMVLLDALVRAAPARAIAVSAVHVDHGISDRSGQWAEFCADQCAQRGIALDIHRLALGAVKRSLEATARTQRYACLRRSDADVVLLAHHADDQAETLLLQALRGASARGLAAMAPFQRGKPAFARA